MTDAAAQRPQAGGFSDYLAIMRLDHSTKHIFIVPGAVLAYLLRGVQTENLVSSIILGFIAAIAIASANYVINEWLDRDFDRHHPTKSARAAVRRELSGKVVMAQWAALIVIGLGCAYLSNLTTFWIASVFALQGVFYNVPPLRTKDKAHLDVISESINNPLRLMIGWAMVDPGSLPPGSIILAYWAGGAFLMAAKRYSEYRQIAASHGVELLVRYRASFKGYSETSLAVSCFVWALLSGFFLAIFLIKYRIEYLLLVPLIIIMFGQYLALSMQPDSAAQKPEKLYREPGLMLAVALLFVTFLLATFVDMPFLTALTDQRFIALPR